MSKTSWDICLFQDGLSAGLLHVSLQEVFVKSAFCKIIKKVIASKLHHGFINEFATSSYLALGFQNKRGAPKFAE